MTSTSKPDICILAGSPRSGTTWIQRLLQAHDKVCGGEESHFFEGFGPAMRMADTQAGFTRNIGPLTYVSRDAYDDMFRTAWSGLFAKLYKDSPNAVIHLEKTPSNCLYLDEAVRLFPNAKIIFVARDSRAVASSIVHAGRSWGSQWAPDSYKDAAIMWWRHCSSVLDWRQRNPDHPFLMLKYEDALEDTDGTLETILNFLMPDADDLQIQATLDTYHADNAAQKEPQGFARVRGTDGWKQDMPLWGKLVTWRYTRKLMKKLGYDISILS